MSIKELYPCRTIAIPENRRGLFHINTFAERSGEELVFLWPVVFYDENNNFAEIRLEEKNNV